MKDAFQFGSTRIQVLTGDLIAWAEINQPDVIICGEDNYLTMQRGFSRQLRERLGPLYARRAQENSPVKVGSIIVSDLKKLPGSGPLADFIFHAALIDFDNTEGDLAEIVSDLMLACLEKAAELNLKSIALPALGAGQGGLTMGICARSLTSAIKLFLAQEKPINLITIVLKGETQGEIQEESAGIRDFKRETNAILDTPYDPSLRIQQSRDFFGRNFEMDYLEKLLKGQITGKRHLALLGGPGIGKFSLLDQLYTRSRQSNHGSSDGRFLVRISFAPLFPETSIAFIYRKFLNAMVQHETDPSYRKELREAFASLKMDCFSFLAFLDKHADRYSEVVFLIDGLPQRMGEVPYVEKRRGADFALEEFYKDLDCLQDRVRFFFTVKNEKSFQAVQGILRDNAPRFYAGLETMWVRSLTETERSIWIDEVYKKYITGEYQSPAIEESNNTLTGSVKDKQRAPMEMHRFVEEEAGLHPFLVSLACYHLIVLMKRYVLVNPEVITKEWERALLRAIIENARKAMFLPRREFLEQIIVSLPHKPAVDLFNLSRAVMLEEQTRILGPALASGDPNAATRLNELLVQGNPRELLHKDELDWLFDHGYIVRDRQGKEILSVFSLAAVVLEKIGGYKRPEDRPNDVTISLLYSKGKSRIESGGIIRTLFNNRTAFIVSTEKPISISLRKEFIRNFEAFLMSRRKGLVSEKDNQTVFRNLEEVGNFLFSQFTSHVVKRYLENPPPSCTINFLLDNQLKDIPWELMLEAVYAGEIPFRVGRSIIGTQTPANIHPAVRRPGKIKALLIGNPTDDLPASENEVTFLSDFFKRNSRFEESDVMLGKEACDRIRILNALSSGRYGLIHYSGHSRFEGEASAWLVGNGLITTDQITSACQNSPPAMVFSSSCWSAKGGVEKALEYENQAFDLPGAFLSSGVEVYLGTLWEVDASATRRLVERFYTAFLNGENEIGECLRRARQSLKMDQERNQEIDWLAFILYGDPRLMPAEIFPALRQ